MTTSLKGKQAWLTRQGTQLDDTVKRLEEFFKSINSVDSTSAYTQVRTGTKELELRIAAAEKALNNFTSAADSTNLTEDNAEKATQNISTAQEILERAENLSVKLQLKLEEFNARRTTEESEQTARPSLPPLQIPKFKGQPWEWDQFWGIFSSVVDSRRISKIEKLNYLIEALQGPARDAVQDLQITEGNYDIAIDLLKNRFGSQDAIVGRLLSSMQTLNSRTTRLSDQRRILDKIASIVSQLRQKGEAVDTEQMKRTILGKFSEKIQRSVLKRRKSSSESWTTQDLLNELSNYFATEDDIQYCMGTGDDTGSKGRRTTEVKTSSWMNNLKASKSTSSKQFPCFYCHRTDHIPLNCKEFPTHAQRIEQMQRRNLCRNCGASSHSTLDCTRGPCRQCFKKGHHTSICRQSTQTPKEVKPPQPQPETRKKARDAGKAPTRQATTQNFAAFITQQDSPSCKLGKDTVRRASEEPKTGDGVVDLLVGQARVWNRRSEEFEDAYVILDTGANQSFITSAFAHHLGLQDNGKMQLTIHTFGSSSTMERTCESTMVEIEDKKGHRHLFKVAKIDHITGDIQRSPLQEQDRAYLGTHDVSLSVCPRNRTVTPHILLGCGDVFSLFDKGLTYSHELPSGLKLLPSRLGYLVAGRNREVPEQREAHLHMVTTSSTQNLDDDCRQWDQYWSLDSAGIEEYMGPQSQEVENLNKKIWDQFRETVERHDDGYHVRLPWKESTDDLPDNKTIAYNRLRSVLDKLKGQPSLLEQYHNTFVDQLAKGIIEEVDENAEPDGKVVHYLAHQAVVTPHKDTTKLRVVFDGSAHLKNAPCLNDKLHQGPVILPPLIDMLNRFRLGRIAIISDVEKAFLQVHLQKIDRDATRCLWVKDVSQPLTKSNMVTYRFTRVTFGLNCSPFLLGATIREHLDQTSNRELAEEIKENIYVDNILLTAATPQEAVDTCLNARLLFSEIHMNLREFRTNSAEANEMLPSGCLGTSTTPKVLGIPWNSERDTMNITCSYPEKETVTKRSVSEQVAAVYDPLGWLTPLTLRPKLFLQALWKGDYTWDQELSAHHKTQWTNLLQEIHGFRKHLPRLVGNGDSTTRMELVTFTDASKDAMATCVYAVQNGAAQLLMAKSKLPSIKDRPTIPKLEMNALTMGARLTYAAYNAIKDRTLVDKVTIFTDSEIALNWLKNPKLDAKVGVLVRNRAREIRRIAEDLKQKNVTVTFGYVNTELNPADYGTRGVVKEELDDDHIWWSGPSFLREAKHSWPTTEELSWEDEPEPVVPGTIFTTVSSPTATTDLIDWTRHSTITKAVSSFSYALRWLERVTKRSNPELQRRICHTIPELLQHYDDDFISVPERECAWTILLRNHQQIHVEPSKNRRIDLLRPFKTSEGIIRCRGRLQHSELPENAKYPILIGPRTPLATMIIGDAHSSLHLSTAHTMARVREKYWIPQLRSQVQKVIRRCVPCQRMNNLPYRYPEMSDLPTRRVTRSRPFCHVGIDYFGPLSVKLSNGDPSKAYGIILTCTVTRLLHLECVSDMSTEQLLNALRRFFARRGVPETITSDNGPYFLLGSQILDDELSRVVTDHSIPQVMAKKGITWKTITPYAPWQGAFYERLIKSVKHSLYKAMGRSVVSIETLTTLLVEIEGSLNTRPLTYLEERWEDQPIIRPIDFIQRDLLVTYPMESGADASDDPEYYPPSDVAMLQTRRQTEEALRSSYQLTEKFWHVWSDQYLKELRERHVRTLPGNHGTPKQPEPGQVVLVADPNLPRNTWKMGRITNVRANKEGLIREAELILPNRRTIRRPINLLIPLEIQDSKNVTDDQQPDVDLTASDLKSDDPKDTTEDVGAHDTTQRYNLRTRQRVNYDLLHRGGILTILGVFTLLSLCGISTATSLTRPVRMGIDNTSGTMQCTTEGILVTTTAMEKYELCSEGYCVIREAPPPTETIRLPPEITLHDYRVQWKISSKSKLKTTDMTCPATAFCSRIDCWLCTANLFNPECQPRTAILVLAAIIYLMTALLYTLCYIPVVIGTPFRLLFRLGQRLFGACWRCSLSVLYRLCNVRRRQNRPSRVGFIPLVLIIFLSHTGQGCQDVDIFQHKTTVCSLSKSHPPICTIDITEVIKLNTITKDACIRLHYQGHLMREIRVQWNRLQLKCERQTLIFTRDTKQRVVDAKRCAHAGSCVEDKCAGVNTSALLPELHQGNRYPGLTFCVESCGGPGCGCFFMSSGCLFYRIYAKPLSEDIFEIFRCPRWNAELIVDITIAQNTRVMMQQEIALRPTIPHDIGGTTIKISSLVIPPTPALQTSFISDGKSVALWKSPHPPTLQCPSWKDAKDLQCELHPKCRCQPAEITVRCICDDHNLVDTFHTSLVNRLPVRRPWISFEEDQNERDRVSVMAVIPTLSDAEILLSMKGEVNSTVKEVTDSLCKVNNAEITGCYQCTQGAVAHIECQSQDDNTMATVICEDFTFSVPCSPRGTKSSLRFNFQRARIHLSCTVSCGQTETNFDVTGILHWTRTFYSAAEKILAGESNIYNEVALPDIGHITSVFLAWYKFSLVILGILVISVIAGYFFFFNCGLRIALLVVRVIGNVILRVVRTPILLLWRTIWKLRESSRKRHTSKDL